MNRREAALAALAEEGVEPEHAERVTQIGDHGHGPLCCCLTQLCRRRSPCNVNAKIVDMMVAEGDA